MITGTTVKHTFGMPIDTGIMDKIKITYYQGGKKVLEKYKEDCTLEGKVITCRLTQEDTLKFKQDDVQIRIRVKTKGGDVRASRKYTVFCEDLLDEEVL